ncbi:uncharacterized protein LOC114330100 isoform X3 [Diabrotica virgifera virgifera]|uniref:Uncharacterized protein LOC114330100 isoform X3 n=1 Tax=Diabrotica virgifera virgifera TaxID=50390 RepID=A0A6P7FJN0_DIAVI|nr:uncharacterized protein LOC114330100 isoform X3 [Diabrotica virgifera virgifera]
MNLEIFFIVIISLLGVQSSDMEKYFPMDLQYHVTKQCEQQISVNLDGQNLNEKGSNDIEYWFWSCFLKKLGFLTDDNKFNEEGVQKRVGNNQKIIEDIRNCFPIDAVTKEEVDSIAKCIARI